MTPVWIVLGVLLICGLYFALEAVNAPTLPTFDEHAATACKVARPALRVDTATGSHDSYPHMTDNTRDIVTAYCERMFRHTQEMP